MTSGFYLIAPGLPGTILTAGALNLLVAFIAWALSKRIDQHPLAATIGASTARLAMLLVDRRGARNGTGIVPVESHDPNAQPRAGQRNTSFELMLAAFIGGFAAEGSGYAAGSMASTTRCNSWRASCLRYLHWPP